MLHLDNSKLQTNDSKLKIDDSKLRINDSMLQTDDSKLQINDFTLQIIKTKSEKRFSNHRTNKITLIFCSIYESFLLIVKEFYHENAEKQEKSLN